MTGLPQQQQHQQQQQQQVPPTIQQNPQPINMIQRQSVHQRIGARVMPVALEQPATNVMQGQPITGYKIVRVRAKDGTIHIKKVRIFHSASYQKNLVILINTN